MASSRFNEDDVKRELPSRGEAALFSAKVAVLRLQRSITNVGTPVPRLKADSGEKSTVSDSEFVLVAESRTPLWTETHPTEQTLEMGKVHNLRLAARALNGTVIPRGQVFSFWRQLGPATARRGFVSGRQLQEGCLIPAVGGGICQFSNALYDVALLAGCEIVERHPHTRAVPGSAAEAGRDATVAWNHIDLRFRAAQDMTLDVRLTETELVVRAWGKEPIGQAPADTKTHGRTALKMAKSCATCGETECHRHASSAAMSRPGRRIWLLDASWPEFRAYVGSEADETDGLLVPLKGKRYDWTFEKFDLVKEAKTLAFRRALGSRRLSEQGPARRKFELDMANRLADWMADHLEPEATRLVVDVRFLARLWQSGQLGGRQFEVLLTRWPMKLIHDALDSAAEHHPERKLLADFRARQPDVDAEWEALAFAARVVTPHASLAARFADRVLEVPWSLPDPRPVSYGTAIAFPGPTAARKGAYEVREAAKALQLEVVLLGSELEGEGFWEGVTTRRPQDGEDWLEGVGLVVQPAVVEDRPKRLLEALSCGIPVIATEACGLRASSTVTIVQTGDAPGLIDAIRSRR